jgi:probable HAF family extracellular repeat protein
LNNKGEVVGGIADENHNIVEAFLWKDGSYVRLSARRTNLCASRPREDAEARRTVDRRDAGQ